MLITQKKINNSSYEIPYMKNDSCMQILSTNGIKFVCLISNFITK